MVFTELVRIEFGAVNKVRFYLKVTELIFTPKKIERRQKKNTVRGQERDTWENILYLQTLVRTIQTKYDRKYQIDVRPVIEEATMTGTEWKTEEEEMQQGFLWLLDPKATDQITHFEYRIKPDNEQIEN